MFEGYVPNFGVIRSSREVVAFVLVPLFVHGLPVCVELETTIKPFPFGSTVPFEFPVVFTLFVEVAFPLPKSEPIETVAEASEERAFGTIFTIPILKKTSINKIAPMTIILRSVFIM